MNNPEIDAEMGRFKSAVEAFLALPAEEQRRRLDEAATRAKEESDRFERAISFNTQEERDFLHRPMTI